MGAKKDHILFTAEKLFGSYGIHKTTMDDIAKKARMGKSTLYYYFESKEDIFGAIIQKDLQLFKIKLEDALNNAPTPPKKVYTYITARMKHLKELVNFYTTLREEYLEHYAFVENIRTDFAKYELDTLTSLLKDGVNKKVFRVKDINGTARMISFALKGLEDALFIKKESTDIEQDGRQMLNLILHGIEAR